MGLYENVTTKLWNMMAGGERHSCSAGLILAWPGVALPPPRGKKKRKKADDGQAWFLFRGTARVSHDHLSLAEHAIFRPKWTAWLREDRSGVIRKVRGGQERRSVLSWNSWQQDAAMGVKKEEKIRQRRLDSCVQTGCHVNSPRLDWLFFL